MLNILASIRLVKEYPFIDYNSELQNWKSLFLTKFKKAIR